MDINIQDAVVVLKKFIIAMNKWEGYIHLFEEAYEKGIDEEPLNVKASKDLDAIFNTFCTLKERKYGRQAVLACGYPPEYSPDEAILATEALKKNKVAITTQQQTGVKNRYRYTLHYKNNEWRIDKKEVYDEDDDKWKKWSL